MRNRRLQGRIKGAGRLALVFNSNSEKAMNATHEYMGIPDYYCGCLIWQEKGRSFPFCGYDGHVTYRAMTRAEVEHWAEQHAHLADDDDIFRLQSIYYRLTSCRSSLDRESGIYPPPINNSLQLLSVQCAQICTKLDEIIAQLLPKR